MKSIVKVGKTVKDAKQEALKELNLTEEDVTIDILREPSKGLFGFIGVRDAKIEVTVTNDPIELARNFLIVILDKMKVDAKLNISRDGSNVYINVEEVNEQDKGIVIGKKGKTLNSMQYLISLIINKDREKYLKVVLDVGNYREKREQTLVNLAKKMAEKSKNFHKHIKLEPMSAYERKIIHSTLQKESNITTHSEGREPYRRVVIESK